MISLGQSISCNASQTEDRQRVLRSWEAAFWRNSKILLCQKIPSSSRLCFWGMLSRGIGGFRYCMWTPSKTAASYMEGKHNKILQRILAIAPQSDESAERFCRRRNRAVAAARAQWNLSIAQEWSLSTIRWVEHLKRHMDMPASLLLEVQCDIWMETMRALRWTVSRDPSAFFGATGTRAGPGRPLRWGERWLAKIDEALGLENTARNKGITRERAALLRTFLQYGTLHGAED